MDIWRKDIDTYHLDIARLKVIRIAMSLALIGEWK
jgi:hypothetical protein